MDRQFSTSYDFEPNNMSIRERAMQYRIQQLRQQQRETLMRNTGMKFRETQELSFAQKTVGSSGNNDKLRQLLINFSSSILSSQNTSDEINIDEVKREMQKIIDCISENNKEIQSWYDDKFISDKQTFFDSIAKTDEIYNSFMDDDLLFIE